MMTVDGQEKTKFGQTSGEMEVSQTHMYIHKYIQATATE